MIIDDIADVINEAYRKRTAKVVGKLFNRERKTIYNIANGCGFWFNCDFVAGLSALGYELILVKKGGKR